MITISPEQDKLLSGKVIQNFAKRTISFLRDSATQWSINKNDDELTIFIDSMITFAHSIFIFDENNIQQLILFKIEFNYAIPLSDYNQMLLGRQYFDELYRINQFHRTLTSNNNLIRITLDSDLDSIR